MNYLLDTNIVVIDARDNDISRKMRQNYRLFDAKNNLAISVVTIGEIKSIEEQFNYGLIKKTRVKKLLSNLLQIDINTQTIHERYAEIDAFSQGKLKGRKVNFSARNMGKNDLWIAATASVYQARLLTTDKDFIHLDGVFLDVEYIDLKELKARI